MTTRLSIEIQGVPYENTDKLFSYLDSHGLLYGGTGPKVRPVVSCKGTTCVFGLIDTYSLSEKIHNRFYLGYRDAVLPHKFKISVGGCPNSCIKPSINDFGVEGHRVPEYNTELCRGCSTCAVETVCPMKAAKLDTGKLSVSDECNSCGVCIGKCPFGAVAGKGKVMYRIYVGGTWGKRTRIGTPLSRLVEADEVLPILEKSMLWFRENGYAKERFGMTIDRVGFENLEKALFSNDLIARRDEILAAEIKTK
jgi:dissimilatory sulfite reductase (desulfoviridin) alpha/beta subunit